MRADRSPVPVPGRGAASFAGRAPATAVRGKQAVRVTRGGEPLCDGHLGSRGVGLVSARHLSLGAADAVRRAIDVATRLSTRRTPVSGGGHGSTRCPRPAPPAAPPRVGGRGPRASPGGARLEARASIAATHGGIHPTRFAAVAPAPEVRIGFDQIDARYPRARELELNAKERGVCRTHLRRGQRAPSETRRRKRTAPRRSPGTGQRSPGSESSRRGSGDDLGLRLVVPAAADVRAVVVGRHRQGVAPPPLIPLAAYALQAVSLIHEVISSANPKTDRFAQAPTLPSAGSSPP